MILATDWFLVVRISLAHRRRILLLSVLILNTITLQSLDIITRFLGPNPRVFY